MIKSKYAFMYDNIIVLYIKLLEVALETIDIYNAK